MRALHLLDRISKEFTNDQLDLYLRYVRLHGVVQNLHQLGTGASIADALRKQSAALNTLYSELQEKYPRSFQQHAEKEDEKVNYSKVATPLPAEKEDEKVNYSNVATPFDDPTKLMKFRSDANKCKLCYKQTSGPAELAAASHIHSSVYKLICNYYQLYIHVIKSVQSLKLKYISSRM